MKVTARKRSPDPNQEHLRESKSVWNQAAKQLIWKMIAFKRGLNGRGDPKAGLPSSNIKEPFPPEIGTFLNQMASEYESLVHGAEQIIQEQEHYSQIRRKTAPKIDHTVPSETVEKVLPFAAADGLTTNASWAGSRVWARYFGLKGPGKEFIVDMIDSLVSFKNKLEDVENYLSSSDPNSVPNAVFKVSSFGIGPYHNLRESFDELVALSGMKTETPSAEDEAKNPDSKSIESIEIDTPDKDFGSLIEKLEAIYSDALGIEMICNYLLGKFPDLKEYIVKASDILDDRKLKEIILNLRSESKDFIEIAELTIKFYLEFLAKSNDLLKTKAKNFKELTAKVNNQLKNKNIDIGPSIGEDEPLEATAANSLSRLIKRKLFNLKPNFLRQDIDLDKLKMKCIKKIIETIEIIDIFLNVLENKNSSIDEIFNQFKIFSKKLAGMMEYIILMAEYHNRTFRHEFRQKHNKKDVVYHQILEREINKIRRNYEDIAAMNGKSLVKLPSGHNGWNH